MTTPTEYKFVRVSPDTHRKLRILAAQSGESIIQLIDRLATQESEKHNENSDHQHVRRNE